VGKRNYRYFYLFLVSLSVLCLYILACNVTNIVLRTQDGNGNVQLADAIKDTPATIVEAIICFFSIWSILCLCGYHTYLISLEVSTNEDIKKSFSHNDNLNPFDRGSILVNMANVLCSSPPPSLINLRETIPNRFLNDSSSTPVNPYRHSDNYSNMQHLTASPRDLPYNNNNNTTTTTPSSHNNQSYLVSVSNEHPQSNNLTLNGNDVHF
jgi:hypothetical protein